MELRAHESHDWANKKEKPDKSQANCPRRQRRGATRLVGRNRRRGGEHSCAESSDRFGDLNLAAAQSNADLNTAFGGSGMTETRGS